MTEPAPTAFPAFVPEDETDQQGTAGLDAKTKLTGVWSQVEFWDENGKPYLKEYEGRGLLKDKKVLITGGDSGIGRSVAILMAREGADITFVYLPEEEEDAVWTAEQIEKAGRKAQKLALNIREEANCKKAVDEHVKAFGRVDVLVNNSAMQEVCTDLKDIELERVEMTFRTNILAIFAMIKFALPHMQRGSSIINSGSVAGYMGNPELVDYSSTKGAISALTRALAQQQAPKGIRVNSVAPGIIWTPLQSATKGNPPSKIKGLGTQSAPVGRPGMPVEIATAYVFLASPLGTYFTGETLHGTGGIENQG